MKKSLCITLWILSNLMVLAWQETIPMDVVIILQNSNQQKPRWAFSVRQVNSPHGNYADAEMLVSCGFDLVVRCEFFSPTNKEDIRKLCVQDNNSST